MTTELACLVALAVWGFVLSMVEVTGKTKAAGTEWNAGNRESEQKFPEWVERAGRALGNHKENFPLFLTAVVVTHLVHRTDSVTAWAAIAYVGLRVAHGLVYIAGIQKLRSLLFLGSLICVFAIFSRLLAG